MLPPKLAGMAGGRATFYQVTSACRTGHLALVTIVCSSVAVVGELNLILYSLKKYFE